MQIVRIVLVSALVALTACSSALSKEEFIEQADQICQEADEQTQDLQPPRTPDALAEFVAEAQKVTEDLLDRLRELEPPDADQEVIDSLLATIEEAMAYLPQIQQAAEERDLQAINRLGQELQRTAANANQIARDYGLEKCGRSQPAPVP